MSSVRPWAARFALVLGLSIGVLAAATNQAAAGGLLQPSSFASLGDLPDQSGAYSIDTNDAVMTLPDGSTIQGVFDPSYSIAVFTFNSVQLDNASFTATGANALALLSLANMTLTGSSFQLSASSGPSDFQGGQSTPGPGAYGSDSGPGAGTISLAAGGGGGFGGAGGHGGNRYSLSDPDYTPSGGLGGQTYGGRSSPFQGGSGGGGGEYLAGFAGAGGGAIELGASGNVHLISTTILANGGMGNVVTGGGSGGSIALLGKTVSLDGAQLSAHGGDGGMFIFWGGFGAGSIDSGGGGGGGIIDIEGRIDHSDFQYDLSGGAGYANGNPGLLFTSVPEPSGLLLASMATLTCVSWGLLRRRSGALKSWY